MPSQRLVERMVGERLCFPFLSGISFGRACRGKPLSETAFRKDETGRVRLAVLKLHAKERDETPVPRPFCATPASAQGHTNY